MTHGHKKRHRLNPRRLFERRRSAPGAPPGTLNIPPEAPKPQLTVFAYDGDRCIEARPAQVAELREFLDKYPVTWINVDGIGDRQTLEDLGRLFHLHPLALEDVVNTHQRSKVDRYAGNLFIVMRMVQRQRQLESEQVSMFLGKNYVLTFQEALPGDSFDAVRARLREAGPLTGPGADYLAYRLIDGVVDNYFPVLEEYGEIIESLETEVLESARRETMNRVHEVKRDLLFLRRAIWPMREAVNQLVRDPNPLVGSETRLFLRDCYDHTVQLIDLLETYRDLGSDLRDLYLSSTSNRLNEIMKVLTIISTIFIPLTFVVGIYGMNFDPDWSPWNMPELRAYYGYPITMLVMLLIGVSLLFYFWRRGWIGKSRDMPANRQLGKTNPREAESREP